MNLLSFKRLNFYYLSKINPNLKFPRRNKVMTVQTATYTIIFRLASGNLNLSNESGQDWSQAQHSTVIFFYFCHDGSWFSELNSQDRNLRRVFWGIPMLGHSNWCGQWMTKTLGKMVVLKAASPPVTTPRLLPLNFPILGATTFPYQDTVHWESFWH